MSITLKELKITAKKQGLKNYSVMKKADLQDLIDLDSQGKAPVSNMTNKRKKELKNSSAVNIEKTETPETVVETAVILPPQKVEKKKRKPRKKKEVCV